MLGSMFGGGGEELGWQEFAAGGSELLPEQGKKLAVLTKALVERPGLSVEIEGNVDKTRDREAVQLAKLRSMIGTNDYVAKLRVAYAEAWPRIQEKLNPPPPPKFGSNVGNMLAPGTKRAAPPVNATQAKKTAAELPVGELEKNYSLIIEVTDDDYRPLALARAEAVRRYLTTTGKIEAERVAVINAPQGALPAGGTRANFTLQ
jgi:hypothetical protein